MSRRTGAVIGLLAAVALCMSVFCAALVGRLYIMGMKDIQYVLYLGTNDKNTNDPVCTPEEAVNRADAILIDHFGGYTIQEASGGWVDDDGTEYHEYTLVIYLSDTDEEAVHAAADDLILEFNQSSVLIQANTTTTEFYSGS